MTSLSANTMLADCNRNKGKLDKTEAEALRILENVINQGLQLTGRQMGMLAVIHMKALGNPDDHDRATPETV